MPQNEIFFSFYFSGYIFNIWINERKCYSSLKGILYFMDKTRLNNWRIRAFSDKIRHFWDNLNFFRNKLAHFLKIHKIELFGASLSFFRQNWAFSDKIELFRTSLCFFKQEWAFSNKFELFQTKLNFFR